MDAPEELRQAVEVNEFGDLYVRSISQAPLGYIAPEGRPAVADALRAAARLRSLAARLDQALNRDQSFTGAQVAAMLRDGKG